MTSVIVTARALLLNVLTNKTIDVVSDIVPEKMRSVVLSRIKKSGLTASMLPGIETTLKWDADVVKVVFHSDALPSSFIPLHKPVSDQAVYVKGKKGVDFSDKDVKDAAVYKAVLDEFQVKIVYPRQWKRAVLRTKTSKDQPAQPDARSPREEPVAPPAASAYPARPS